MLLGIAGRRRVGKDTVADYIVKRYGFEKKSFAQPLKEAAALLFGFSEEQLHDHEKDQVDPYWDVTPRDIFRWLGTDVFRKDIQRVCPIVKDDFWIRTLERRGLEDRTVISDVRFINEVDFIHKKGGFVIKIERGSQSEEDPDRISSQYDFLIRNDSSIDDLYHKVDEVLSEILKE